MSKISLKLAEIGKAKLMIIAALAVIFAALPMLAFSSHGHKIFVNAGASGTQDGSSSHPYKTITQAINAAHGDTEIHVANGTYRENITVRMNVYIFGANKNKTIIEAADSDDDTVIMKDGTKINKVTVRGGKNGVKVKDKSRASIIDCVIKGNHKDGINIESDGTKDDKRVSISDNTIKSNRRAGIFSGKRKLSITDNDIHDNDKDGVDIAKGSRVWMADNDIQDNGASGAKLRIDGSEIWTKNNDYKNNGREGMEVIFENIAAGRIDIAKSNFSNNKRYGIARVQDDPVSANTNSLWKKYLTLQNNNKFGNNDSGDISPVIVRK